MEKQKFLWMLIIGAVFIAALFFSIGYERGVADSQSFIKARLSAGR